MTMFSNLFDDWSQSSVQDQCVAGRCVYEIQDTVSWHSMCSTEQ